MNSSFLTYLSPLRKSRQFSNSYIGEDQIIYYFPNLDRILIYRETRDEKSLYIVIFASKYITKTITWGRERDIVYTINNFRVINVYFGNRLDRIVHYYLSIFKYPKLEWRQSKHFLFDKSGNLKDKYSIN